MIIKPCEHHRIIVNIDRICKTGTITVIIRRFAVKRHESRLKTFYHVDLASGFILEDRPHALVYMRPAARQKEGSDVFDHLMAFSDVLRGGPE